MASKKDQPMLDPIAYREDYPEENIVWTQNANLNYSMYGDDSNPEHQSTLGWLASKNEWEWVNTSNIEYNPDITTSDLDAYKYWEAARQQNAQEAWYIARRNDNIASALYNEWKLSKEEIAYYLSSQPDWNNSTEMDRANTIESIYKRMWEMKPQENKSEEAPEMNLDKDTSTTIYGKSTADTWKATKWIKTNEDVNSPFNLMDASRSANFKAINSMDSSSIAASVRTWEIPYWEQAYRDMQIFNPVKYQEVQDILKQLQWQDVIDSITNGTYDYETAAEKNNKADSVTNYAINNSSLSVSATQLLKSIDSILQSNKWASNAEETMDNIAADMYTLKQRMLWLRKEANNIFKWDVPDYIVNAYINNRSQEIQNQLSILEWRYNAAYDRYKTELSHAEREAEYDLKKDANELEWYKAINSSKTTTTNDKSNYTVAERNNNPTNMTVDWMKRAWAELWVDYEVGTDSFINSNWNRQYYAKLIWDPLDTTIKVLNKAIAAGKNPFNTTSWSYMDRLWMTVDRWNNMSDEERKKYITDVWLPNEWWDINNMAYYIDNPWIEYQSNTKWYWYKWWEFWFDPALEWAFKQYLKTWKLWASSKWYQDILNTYKITEQEFWTMYRNWTQYNQNQWNQAWIDVLEDMAALWLRLEDAWRIEDSWEFDINWSVWYDPLWMEILSWPINASLDKLIAELKLQKMVTARNNNVSFWQVTEAEWKMIWDAATILKQATWLWSTDKDFTDAYKDLLNAVWKATFHEDYSDEQWQQFVKDKKEWRTNVNVAILTNNTSWVKTDKKDSDDAISDTFNWFSTWDVAQNPTWMPSMKDI